METLKVITQKTGEFPVTVYYEDTDLTGFVYHANYLKYFERAREELIGIDSLKELYDLGYHFVVKDVHLNFKKPAYHADSLIVKSRVVFDSPVIVNCYQEVVNIKTNISLVLGTIKLVVVNKKSQPSRIPANWVKSILN